MDEAGILVFLFFYDDSSCIWDCDPKRDRKVPAEEADFVRAIVDRFEHLRHLVWVVAEEYEEAFHPQRVRNLAHLIRKYDDHGHPIAVHKLAGFDFTEFDPADFDQFAIQAPSLPPDELHEALVGAFAAAGGRYNLNLAEMADHGTGRSARLTNWSAAMAGAYVMVLGWDVATTADDDLHGCGILRRFMEGTPLSGLVPRDELAAGDTEYVLCEPDSSDAHGPRAAVLYASDARDTMGLARFGPPRADLTWVDPATGQIVEQAGVEPLPPTSDDDGTARWTLPDGWSGEVAVYVRRAATTRGADEP